MQTYLKTLFDVMNINTAQRLSSLRNYASLNQLTLQKPATV